MRGNLRIRRSTLRPGTRVLYVAGEIDLATASLLDLAVQDSEHARAMVVDLSEVGFMGFAGVDVLVRAAERAEGRLHRFAVVVSSRPTERVFGLSDAYARVSCYPRLDTALRAVARRTDL
ncbi:STAS domain-containing protein [Nocardia tenerifensis]|uniref:STAS domain-containing protein n=1 Tax=Nocardia tenerifensis TaxID=228006 RepID=UPI0002F46900|nr:STAS domain-containing protein [Nocardia tenerifensis]